MVRALKADSFSRLPITMVVVATVCLSGCGASVGSVQNSTSGPPAAPLTSIVISPTTAQLYPGETQRFDVAVTGPDRRIVWTVEHPSGSAADVGTVDSEGNYTAPAAPSYGLPVAIRATSVADPARSALASVTYRFPPEIEAVHEHWLSGVADVAPSYGCTGVLVVQQDPETTSDVIARFATTAGDGSCIVLSPISLNADTLRYSVSWGGTVNQHDIIYISDVGVMRIWNGVPVVAGGN
jgi:hypothetical protein